MLLHALYERLCTTPLNRLPCYGALEVIVTLLLLILLLSLSLVQFLFNGSISRDHSRLGRVPCKEPLGIFGVSFYMLNAFPLTQPTVSNY